MRDGILLIDKPKGISSAGVVARTKRILKADRVGHAGTLDPDATGLLILLINGATRVASYAADGYKVYSGEIQLGVSTSTDDIAGDVIARAPVECTWEMVREGARGLTGEIEQIPPTVSAKKVGGKRAYRLHREGEEVILAPRRVDVRAFDLWQTQNSPDLVGYRVEVSPGTYVRALARDLGKGLGCGATVVSIRREISGHFSVRDGYSLDAVSWEGVLDWGMLVPELPRIALDSEIVASLLQGQPRGVRDAWQVAGLNGLETVPSHVVYHRQGSDESLGILKVVPAGGFEFCLNIARHEATRGVGND